MYDRIVFDLDGTLTDSKAGIRESVNFALKSFGLPELGPEKGDYEWIIGPPLRESLWKLADGRASESFVEELTARYRRRYESVGIFENSLYPGIVKMLDSLAGEGRTMAIATTKPVVQARAVVEHFGLGSYFRTVAGSELDGRMSDKYELIRSVMRALGGSPSGYVMAGDREHDIKGARKAGIDSVGVLWGYGTSAEVLAAAPTFTAASPAELLAILSGR